MHNHQLFWYEQQVTTGDMGEERTGLFSLSQACWSDQHVFFAKLFFLQPVQLFKTCGALFFKSTNSWNWNCIWTLKLFAEIVKLQIRHNKKPVDCFGAAQNLNNSDWWFEVPESQKFRVFLKHRKSKTENGNLTIKTTVFLVVESCKSRRLGQISSVTWS